MNVTVIKKSRWYRGKGGVQSVLLRREDGKMCCLGFDCLRRGLNPKQIEGVPSPLELGMRQLKVLKEFTKHYSTTCEINVNEDVYIKDAERIKELRELFKVFNTQLRFVK